MSGKNFSAVSRRRGFTLVEMLISLSIFAVVTAFATANFRVGQQGDELRLSARNVASLIRRARTQTVAGFSVYYCHGGADDGKLCPLDSGISCGEGACEDDIPPAYGINISVAEGEEREVRIFADTNDNGRYDDGEAIRVDSISPGPFVSITGVDPVDGDSLDILFDPPKPTTKFNNDIADTIATVELQHQHTSNVATITINRVSGLISVDD
jgi:prepilin-type N-terminal cleavage/methylation domain-containing protein